MCGNCSDFHVLSLSLTDSVFFLWDWPAEAKVVVTYYHYMANYNEFEAASCSAVPWHSLIVCPCSKQFGWLEFSPNMYFQI